MAPRTPTAWWSPGRAPRSVPPTADNLAARAVAALVDAVGPGLPGRARPGDRDQEADPGRGRAGRRQRRRGRGAGRLQRAVGHRAEPGRTGEVAARVGSDVAFALLGGTAVGPGPGRPGHPGAGRRDLPLGARVRHGQLSTAAVYAACDRLRAAAQAGRSGAPGSGPARPGAPAAPPPGPPQLDTALMAALRSGEPGRGRPAAQQRPAAGRDVAAAPAAPARWPRAGSTARWARSCPAPGPTCAYLARDARTPRDLAVALAGAGVCRTVAT